MLSRRELLIGGAVATVGVVPLVSRLLTAATGSAGAFTLPVTNWSIAGGAALDTSLGVVYTNNAFTVTEGGVTKAQGYRPAAAYSALWTRDDAYTLWHYPTLRTAAQRRQIVTYQLSKRDASNFIPDRIDSAGGATYKNWGQYPFMDGAAMVVLLLWADWNLTGDTTTFTANQSAIDSCLAAIPRSVNGCVYSDPANPSVDYGFTDGVTKTGDCAYGTALQAWAYKMLDEISGGGSSGAESDTYANLRAHAESGLATLLNGTTKFYKGSSVNCASVDDVWCTALVIAEGLSSGTDRIASATALRDAYLAGTISQRGRVRHLPTPQVWPDVSHGGGSSGSYQNGGFWNTPLWDCVRAVAVVDSTTALAWALEAVNEVTNDEVAVYGAAASPNEWLNWPYGVVGGASGYTPSAAVFHRFI